MRPKPRLSERIIHEAHEMMGRCRLCGFVRRILGRDEGEAGTSPSSPPSTQEPR